MTQPSEEVFNECVEKSGNSAPGHDRVPFRIWRILRVFAVPLLPRVFALLAAGIKPCVWWLRCRLALIGKKDPTWDEARGFFLDYEDQRPISASLVSYRLVMGAIAPILRDSVQFFCSSTADRLHR